MNENVFILLSIIDDRELIKIAIALSRDTMLGNNYMFWKEEDVEKEYENALSIEFSDDFYIVGAEEIRDIHA